MDAWVQGTGALSKALAESSSSNLPSIIEGKNDAWKQSLVRRCVDDYLQTTQDSSQLGQCMSLLCNCASVEGMKSILAGGFATLGERFEAILLERKAASREFGTKRDNLYATLLLTLIRIQGDDFHAKHALEMVDGDAADLIEIMVQVMNMQSCKPAEHQMLSRILFELSQPAAAFCPRDDEFKLSDDADHAGYLAQACITVRVFERVAEDTSVPLFGGRSKIGLKVAAAPGAVITSCTSNVARTLLSLYLRCGPEAMLLRQHVAVSHSLMSKMLVPCMIASASDIQDSSYLSSNGKMWSSIFDCAALLSYSDIIEPNSALLSSNTLRTISSSIRDTSHFSLSLLKFLSNSDVCRNALIKQSESASALESHLRSVLKSIPPNTQADLRDGLLVPSMLPLRSSSETLDKVITWLDGSTIDSKLPTQQENQSNTQDQAFEVTASNDLASLPPAMSAPTSALPSIFGNKQVSSQVLEFDVADEKKQAARRAKKAMKARKDAQAKLMGKSSIKHDSHGGSSGSVSTATSDIDHSLLCELDGHVMKEPVLTPSGHRFDRSSIMKWMLDVGNVCPITGEGLEKQDLTPDKETMAKIKAWSGGRSL